MSIASEPGPSYSDRPRGSPPRDSTHAATVSNTGYMAPPTVSPIPPTSMLQQMPGASPYAMSPLLRNMAYLHAPNNRFPKLTYDAELSQRLSDFVITLLPTPEELNVKEDVRRLLEKLIRTIEPECRLLSFGSTANGFSLKNSDMDLCCLISSDRDGKGKEKESTPLIRGMTDATALVLRVSELLERETKFEVKPLPHARIPIIKLSLPPSPGLPFGIACDIGFDNRLALENTRLLMSYALIDPERVRGMVLFLKVWSKRRRINSPYRGTLSSYGYVLLVIYFLIHVKNPPVLPNLQSIPAMRDISEEDTHINGRNVWFYDDIETLRTRWQSANDENVAELLIDFFRYFSKEFLYNTGVASIRAGLLKKESKGWLGEGDTGSSTSRTRYTDLGPRNKLCIEDPFETDFNVARSVTRDGLYVIRGEFMRAYRLLTARMERPVVAIAHLCEERPEEILPPLVGNPLFVAPIVAAGNANTASSSSTQAHDSGKDESENTPSIQDNNNGDTAKYSPVVNNNKIRISNPVTINPSPTPLRQPQPQHPLPIAMPAPTPLSPAASTSTVTTADFAQSDSPSSISPSTPSAPQTHVRVPSIPNATRIVPAHMAPRRAQWTSPPPQDIASEEDLRSFELRFGRGLEAATAASVAREKERDKDPDLDLEVEGDGSEVGSVISASESGAGSSVNGGYGFLRGGSDSGVVEYGRRRTSGNDDECEGPRGRATHLPNGLIAYSSAGSTGPLHPPFDDSLLHPSSANSPLRNGQIEPRTLFRSNSHSNSPNQRNHLGRASRSSSGAGTPNANSSPQHSPYRPPRIQSAQNFSAYAQLNPSPYSYYSPHAMFQSPPGAFLPAMLYPQMRPPAMGQGFGQGQQPPRHAYRVGSSEPTSSPINERVRGFRDQDQTNNNGVPPVNKDLPPRLQQLHIDQAKANSGTPNTHPSDASNRDSSSTHPIPNHSDIPVPLSASAESKISSYPTPPFPHRRKHSYSLDSPAPPSYLIHSSPSSSSNNPSSFGFLQPAIPVTPPLYSPIEPLIPPRILGSMPQRDRARQEGSESRTNEVSSNSQRPSLTAGGADSPISVSRQSTPAGSNIRI